MDTLKKIGYWTIGLLAIGGFLVRLIEGPSGSNPRCSYHYWITPEFIYWMMLASAIGASYAFWYGHIRGWKIDLLFDSRFGLALVPVPLTLFFSFTMWFCGDNPRYREDKVGEIPDKSAYEMYVTIKVPTPSFVSH